MKSLDKPDARMIKAHINELRQDPYTPRPQCDIIKEKGKRPPLYRLRVGRHRAEFFIEGDTVFISKMFSRSGDSDYQQSYKERAKRFKYGCRNCQRDPNR
jgi:mRNA-degrading endonuclease RelE of RelBE toxin-antitoxin system